jgi:hypothetical protein
MFLEHWHSLGFMIANLFKESDIPNIRIKIANDMVFSHKNTGNKGLVTSFNHKVLFCVFFPSLIFGLFYFFLHPDIIQFTNCSLRRVGAIELSVDSNVSSSWMFAQDQYFFCGPKISICHGTIYAL